MALLDEAASGFLLDAPTIEPTNFPALVGINIHGFSASPYFGNLSLSGDWDTYELKADIGANYTIVTGDGLPFWGSSAGVTTVVVWDALGNFITATDYNPSIDVYGTGFLATQSTYYLTAYSDSVGYYGFRVNNSSISEGNPISEDIEKDHSYSAALDFASDVDSFVFTLSAGESIDISISSFGIDLFLGFQNTLLETIDSATINGEGSYRFLAPSTGIYTLQVTANDGRSTGSYVLSTDTLNQGPTVWSNVTYTGDLIAGEVLDASASFFDIDGNSDGVYRTGWYLDGTLITVSETFALSAADYGKEVSVRFDLTDDAGNFEISAPYLLGTVNTPTNWGDPASFTGDLIAGEVLDASVTYFDADGNSDGVYRTGWYLDGVLITVSETFTLIAADYGKEVSVRFDLTDDAGVFELSNPYILGTVNTPAAGTVVVSGSVSQGEKLTANTSGLVDPDGLGDFSYQWMRNGVPIPDATASMYELSQEDVGSQISVQVDFVDGAGAQESVTSAATAAVTNNNDAPTGTVLITGTATQGEQLTADPSGLSDPDGLGSFSYQWLRDGVPIATATANMYELTEDDVGSQISVDINYTDGGGTAENVTSAETATVATNNEDLQGDSGDNTLSGGDGEDTLSGGPGSDTLEGGPDADRFVVKPGDEQINILDFELGLDILDLLGFDRADALSAFYNAQAGSAILTFGDGTILTVDGDGVSPDTLSLNDVEFAAGNLPPEGAVVIEGTAIQGETLTANTDAVEDLDGIDTSTEAGQWLRDGAPILGATGETYLLTQEDVGAHLSVVYSFTDNFGTNESVTSTATAVVANANDDPTGEVIVTGTPAQGETLTANTDAVQDPDGIDTSTEARQWLRDGTSISGANGETYVLVAEDVGAQISFVYSFTDNFGTPETITSTPTATVSVVGLNVVGTPFADTLEGGPGADTIQGLGSDDTIAGSAGNDQIDGGEGTDTVVYTGDQATFTVTLSPVGTSVTDRRPDGNGTDTLTSIEILDFDSGTFDPLNLSIFGGPASLSAPELESFIELYIAYFNRAPDAIGLNFWGTAFANGLTLEEMAEQFGPQPETLSAYPPGTSNEVFATTVYNNVLGRTPDQAGINFWVRLLDQGNVSRDQFILSVLQGAKSELKPELGPNFVAQQLADQAYLENKIDIGAYFAVHKGMSGVENAAAAMAFFDGSAGSITNAVNAIDGFFADALDPTDGEFLMPLVGVLELPPEFI